MAPFVELEWGTQAYGLMKEIKALFDPDGLLNPGVIINDDPAAHLKHLKPMPAAGQLYAPVDRCIECGFCEPQCPSHGLTLSPRQRIVGWRELSRRQASRRSPGPAGRGLPLHGPRHLRHLRPVLHRLPGGHRDRRPDPRGAWREALRRGPPAWQGRRATTSAPPRPWPAPPSRPAIWPKPSSAPRRWAGSPAAPGRKACRARSPWAAPPAATATRSFTSPPAPAACSAPTRPEQALSATVVRVLERGRLRPDRPRRRRRLCCGQSFASKGMAADADAQVGRSLKAALLARPATTASYPIVLDASACSLRMKTFLAERLHGARSGGVCPRRAAAAPDAPQEGRPGAGAPQLLGPPDGLRGQAASSSPPPAPSKW